MVKNCKAYDDYLDRNSLCCKCGVRPKHEYEGGFNDFCHYCISRQAEIEQGESDKERWEKALGYLSYRYKNEPLSGGIIC